MSKLSSSKKQRRRRHPKSDGGTLSHAVPETSIKMEAECPPETTAAPEAAPPRRRWKHALVAAVLMALCAGLYGWTADFPMVFDDHMYMKDNMFFRDSASFTYPTHFTEFVSRPAKLGMDPDLSVNFVLRPVAYASLHLNYMLDGFRPRWFRVVNIGIHAASAFLLYALLRLLLRRSPHAGALPQGSAFFIPLTAAVLFAAHPLATESVTYIIQRFTSLSTLFYLLTLWLYFKSLQGASRAGRTLLRLGSVVVLLAGMLTKESTFTAPMVAVMLDILVLGTRWRTAALRAWPLLLCLPLIPGLVLASSAVLHQGQMDVAHALNIVNSRDTPLNHWHYIVTQITVLAAYLRRIVWPDDLNIDPEWPMHTSFFETPVLLAVLVHGLLIAGAFWLWLSRRKKDPRSALVLAFVLWFFATIFVSSGMVPLPDLMADHRTYLPSIGMFVLAACVFDFLRSWRWKPVRAPAHFGAPALAVICVGALAWTTVVRNEVWSSSEKLWKDTVAKSPGKYRTWGNLGAALSDAGKEEAAVNCYKKALEIEPRFQNGLLNLSNSLLRLNRSKESLENTMNLIRIDATSVHKPPVAFTLGLGLAGVGRFDDAVGIFREILTATPHDPQVHKALGLVYFQTGLYHQALDHYQQAERIQPEDPQTAALMHELEVAMVARGNQRGARPASIFQ
ncbi:MAG: tetratricopeptide repeat protein [Prosthecobacter sp.]